MEASLMSAPDADQELDAAVRAFFLTSNLTATFLRVLDPEDLPSLPAFDAQYKHWVQVMRLSIKFGPFWFYRSPNPSNSPAPLASPLARWPNADSPPPVPFWLIKTARVTVTEQGVTRVMPLEWNALVPDVSDQLHRLWRPHNAQIMAFIQELGLLRERAFKHKTGAGTENGLNFESLRPLLPSMGISEVAPVVYNPAFRSMQARGAERSDHGEGQGALGSNRRRSRREGTG